MNETTERILIEALDLLEQGASIDEIIARYPAQAADLRPFLLTAAALGNLANQPTVTAEAQSKRAFLAAADQAAVERNKPVRAAGGWLRRLVAPVLAVLAVLFLGGAGLVGASGSAVPGDALYETKRLVEEARLNLTANPEAAAQLREQFRRERIREIEALLASGRAAEVSLTGEVESMADGRWTVAGVPVLVSSATVIDGRPIVGALVQVDGLTGDQAVVAERVMVLTAGPAPDPTPAQTETPSPSPTPRPSVTTAANRNDNDDNDNGDDDAPEVPPPGSQPVAPTPAAPAVQPTGAPPAPPPTATPDDDDNDDDNANDNGDDNANDNGDDNANDDANDNGDDNVNDNGAANDNDDSAANDNTDSSDDSANDNDDSGGSNSDDNDNGDDNGDDGGGDNDNGDD